MTRTRTQLSKQIKNFQLNNDLTDAETARMFGTTKLMVFRLRKCLVEWIDLKLLKRLTMVMGE